MRRNLFATASLALLGGLLALSNSAAGQEKPARVLVQPVQQVQPILKPGVVGQPEGTSDENLTDEEALKKAGLSPTDGPKLIEYLRLRTLSDADQGKIAGIIKRFGADDFDERVKATEEIEVFGPAAIGPLRKIAEDRNGDPEVVFRARITLRKLETVPHSAVAASAVRAVVKLKPEGAAGALIGFLPVADTEVVADVIREALVSLAARDGKADPALVAALSDKLPVRRAAAYVALIQGGPATERIRIKDAYPKVKEAVLADADAEAKFIGLWTLALTTREKEFLPELIGMVPKLPRGRIWQLEELLLLMAKEHPKDGRFLRSPEALAKARDAWLSWWKEKGEKIDLVKFEYKPRVAGITDVIEMHSNGYGPGAVVSLGPDLKEKWRISGVQYPTDMRVTPDGKIWVVESSNNRITERDRTGKILKTRYANNQPLNIELLPDGGMMVVCRDRIFQWDKTGNKEEWTFGRPNYDIMAGCRLPGGEILYVTNAHTGENAFRLTAKGEDANKGNDPKRKLQFGRVQQLQSMHAFAEDRVLVCEYNKVAEYDLKTGKQVWKRDTPQNSAQSCQRLPNGNTLIALLNQNQVIEVDPSGEIVWEYAAKDGLRVGRAYRR
jgi:hypothetical protein